MIAFDSPCAAGLFCGRHYSPPYFVGVTVPYGIGRACELKIGGQCARQGYFLANLCLQPNAWIYLQRSGRCYLLHFAHSRNAHHSA
jgi:hypothetical protein